MPYNFHDGVLLMELVADEHGDAAPRLNDVAFTPEQARLHHATLLREVVRMLCAGVVHGDLSEFNVLLGADGPVIIDLPQAVDAAGNNHAQRMLLRDVANLRGFFGRCAPGAAGHGIRRRDLGPVSARRVAALERRSAAASSAGPARWTWAACCARSTTRVPRKRRAGCACKSCAEPLAVSGWGRGGLR